MQDMNLVVGTSFTQLCTASHGETQICEMDKIFYATAPIFPMASRAPNRANQSRLFLAFALFERRVLPAVARQVRHFLSAWHQICKLAAKYAGRIMYLARYCIETSRQLLSRIALLAVAASKSHEFITALLLKFTKKTQSAASANPVHKKSLAMSVFNTKVELTLTWERQQPAKETLEKITPQPESTTDARDPADNPATTPSVVAHTESMDPTAAQKFGALVKYSQLEQTKMQTCNAVGKENATKDCIAAKKRPNRVK